MSDLALLDSLPFLTNLITATNRDGNVTNGTGFFFNFSIGGDRSVIAIVTNRHVVVDAVSASVRLTRARSNGEPDYGNYDHFEVEGFSNLWVGHPDLGVDLAVFPIGALIADMQLKGFQPFYKTFSVQNIPDEQTIASFSAIEDIMMVGYPNGLWDRVNNMPLIRRGITATAYRLDYEGRAEFVIDAACFPGSSGSPVVIASNGSFGAKDFGIYIGPRFYLLGILWGGPILDVEGDIVAREIPAHTVPIAISRVMINLGYCIKARKIMDILPVVVEKATRAMAGRELKSGKIPGL